MNVFFCDNCNNLGRFWWSLLAGVDWWETTNVDWWETVGCTHSVAEDGIGKDVSGDVMHLCVVCSIQSVPVVYTIWRTVDRLLRYKILFLKFTHIFHQPPPPPTRPFPLPCQHRVVVPLAHATRQRRGCKRIWASDAHHVRWFSEVGAHQHRLDPSVYHRRSTSSSDLKTGFFFNYLIS